MVNPILIVPIDDGSRPLNFELFKTNNYKNPDPDNPAEFSIQYEIFSYEDRTLRLYNHIGEYTISCSTYDPNYKPENAFNKSNRGWRSNNNLTGNSNTITTVTKNSANNTYSSATPVVNSTNYFNPHFGPSFFNVTSASTNVTNTNVIGNISNNTITGEWLQIQLPQPIYLFKYIIIVPSPKLNKNDNLKDFLDTFKDSNNNSIKIPDQPHYSSYYSQDQKTGHYVSYIPKIFTIVGSNDGVKWYYVDQQNFVTPPDLSYSYLKSNPNLKKSYNIETYGSTSKIICNVNSVEHYTYFRLIVNEMFPGNQQVRINEWDIYAFVDIITSNADSLKDISHNNFKLNSNGIIEPFTSKTNSLEYLTGMQSNWDYLTNNIDTGLMNLYKEQMSNINDGRDPKLLPHLEGFSLTKLENFDSHGFIEYNDNVSSQQIINNQIIPLNQIHVDLINSQNNVNKNYYDLSQNIYDFSNNYYNLLKDPDDKYDLKSNNFNKPPTKIDGWINDNKEMVLQQNSIYILSTITIATLVIALIIASR
jgi:hypothetical protein